MTKTIGKTVYTDNSVTQDVIDAVVECIERYGKIIVSFDVMGRTKHSLLCFELQDKLQQYDFDISDNYGCVVSKRIK